jgi:hypothetical protein
LKLRPEILRRRWLRISAGVGAYALMLAIIGAVAAIAADAKALSAQLSDEAFALLTSISGKHDTPSPLLGPVGVFAADSQKLSSALQAQDRRSAGAAMAALKFDAAEVDKAGASGGLDAGKWSAIKHDLDSLSTMVAAAPAAPAEAGSEHSERAAAAAKSRPPEVAPSADAAEPSAGPRVRIDSVEMVGADVARVKGYISGRSLRSAGIYLGETRLAKLDVKRVMGEQMIQFNIEIHRPEPGSVLRVYDSQGRSAQATIVGEADAAAPAAPLRESAPAVAMAPPPASPSSANVGLGGGMDAESSELERMEGALERDARSDNSLSENSVSENSTLGNGASENGAAGANTEEIPSAAPPLSGPKSRMQSHLAAHGNNDIQIQIDGVTMVDPGMREYMVKGQIAGSNLKRAGIYVDGKLAQSLPINRSSGFHASNFAQSFTAVGSEATIRVYRSRHNYSETSINLASTSTAAGSMPPITINSGIGGYAGALNPGQLAVQITSVQAAAPSLYVVSGYVSGINIASAGIYQNGALTQPLSLGSGGITGAIGGLISGLIPGMNKQYSFMGRFNPALGYATVRAYNSSGMMAEQPIMAGGSPYGYGMNSYGVNPYGVNPYGVNPYMRSPYAAPNPYTVSPFGGGIGVGPGVGAGPRTGVGVGTAPW